MARDKALKINIQHFASDDYGVTAVEYGLIASGVALGVVTAIFTAGDALGDIFGVMVEAITQVEDNVPTS